MFDLTNVRQYPPTADTHGRSTDPAGGAARISDMGRRLGALIAAAGLLALAPACAEDAAVRGERSTQSPGGRVFVFGYHTTDKEIKRVGIYEVDLPAGQARRLDLGPLGIGDYLKFIDVTAGHLVFIGPGGATYSVSTDLEEEPRRLGTSWYFVPSSSPGRVWLMHLDAESPATERDLSGGEEVGVDGQVIQPGGARPPCEGPTTVAAAGHTLLCQDPRQLVAFDARSGKVVDRVPGPFPLAAGGGLVASCGEPCPRLLLTEPTLGLHRELGPGPGFRWAAGYEGAFSPDERELAVPVELDESDGGGGMPRGIAVVDVKSGAARPIDGASTYADGPMDFSSDGWLYFMSRDGALMAYRSGQPEARQVASLPDVTALDLAAE
jgi:hypothetical protein